MQNVVDVWDLPSEGMRLPIGQPRRPPCTACSCMVLVSRSINEVLALTGQAALCFHARREDYLLSDHGGDQRALQHAHHPLLYAINAMTLPLALGNLNLRHSVQVIMD